MGSGVDDATRLLIMAVCISCIMAVGLFIHSLKSDGYMTYLHGIYLSVMVIVHRA